MSKQVEVPESVAREAAQAIFEQRFGRGPLWLFGYLDQTDARRLGEIRHELDQALPAIYKHFSDRLLSQAHEAVAAGPVVEPEEWKESVRAAALKAISTPEVDRGREEAGG